MSGREATRLGYGLVLLIAPDLLSKTLTGLRLDWRGRTLARVLGVRHLLQAIVSTRTGIDAQRQMGSVVDRMDAASMLVVAVLNPRRRRLALIDATVASLFSLAGTSHPEVDEAPAPDRHVRADTQDPPTAPAPTENNWLLVGDARRHRREAALRQRAILDAVQMGKGQPVERIKRELVRALEARGAGPQPEGWLIAVASDAALGNVYVVSEQALTDTGTVLRRSDPS